MIKRISVGGRRLKNDNRDARAWTGALDLRASREGQQYILAALCEILCPLDDEKQDAKKAWSAIQKVANRKAREYSTQAGDKVIVIQ